MSALGIALDRVSTGVLDAPNFAERLEPREWIIARALVDGQSMPAIAASMHISMEGLTSDIANIFRRLGVATLAHMLLLFAEMPVMQPRADIVYVEDLGMAYGFGAPSRRLE